MPALFNRLFVQHPQSVDETYFQHLRFAGWFATRLMLAGLAALVHAVIPALFEKTAGRLIAEMYEQTHNRGK